MCKAAETPIHKRYKLLGKFILDPVDAKLLLDKKLLLYLAATNVGWELQMDGFTINRKQST